MSIIKTQGLVLKYSNFGEADRILTLLTRDKGKIRVIAKGCRRPKSRFVSNCEIFSCSDFVLYKGTNLYHINSSDLKEPFYELRKDLLKLSYAVFFAELADTVTYEEMYCKNIYSLLANTLFYLSKKEMPIGVLSCAYQVKLLDLSGFRPSVKKCVVCGIENDFTKFNIGLGGVICKNCNETKGSISINPKTLDFFENLLSLPISRLNTIKIDNTIFIEADRIISEFVQMHMDKKFKSVGFINSIKGFDNIR